MKAVSVTYRSPSASAADAPALTGGAQSVDGTSFGFAMTAASSLSDTELYRGSHENDAI